MVSFPPIRTLITHTPLTLLLALSGCMGEIGEPVDFHGDEGEDVSITLTDQTVRDFETGTCSTSAVAPLSRQIAEEMLCIAPGVLVELTAGNGLTFRSSAVLPFMEAEAAQDLLDAAAKRPIELTSGFRTVVQQYLLHRWRAKRRCGITAAAAPGNSNHESGRAIDVGNFGSARATLRAKGWSDPLSRDPVHFEHRSSPDMRGLDVHAFQRLWNRNNPNDQISEDGDYGPGTAARIRQAPARGFAIGPECAGQASDNWIGDSCETDDGCDLPSGAGTCETWIDTDVGRTHGMCIDSCTGACPGRVGEATTFCADLDAPEGTCVAVANGTTSNCGDLAGTEATTVRRFQINGQLSSTVETVCLRADAVGIECSSGGQTGECINTKFAACTGESATGACPGSSDIRCCLGASERVPEPVFDCTVNGTQGTCIDTNTTSCAGQTSFGACSGGNNIRCCTT